MKYLFFKLTLVIIFISTISCFQSKEIKIIISTNSSLKEKLAAKEIRRYIYLRTGELLPIISTDKVTLNSNNSILICTKDRSIIEKLDSSIKKEIEELSNQEYLIRTINKNEKKIYLIIGGDPIGTLYGVYRYAEELGVRFYLHGDVIPDNKINIELPEFNEKGSPLFNLRGILPFHDFPEGPDLWNTEEYKTIIAQLPKLRMNFVGFHCYPEDDPHAEPLVWIGQEKNIGEEGTVKAGYPVFHFYTSHDSWGYSPMKTSEYHCGSDRLFEIDYFGAEYMERISELPHKTDENIRIFNQVGRLLKNSFSFAKKLGVRTCVGTETPLIIPTEVKERVLEEYGEINGQIIKKLYRGIFRRISTTHPLDFYWFWTPEWWVWKKATDKEVNNTIQDLMTAINAAEEIDAPFTLATCGWVLGPSEDRTKFDQILPQKIPMSCINREVGFAPVDTNFNVIQGRPKWAIPWLEDDAALLSPQLWVGRIRKDALDALHYGCTGLFGIHWRTKILGPNVLALARAGWNQKEWSNYKIEKNERHLQSLDLYQEWAKSQFGREVGEQLAIIFNKIDGGHLNRIDKGEKRTANLFRTSEWEEGPGGIKIINEPWDKVNKKFSFIDEFESYKPKIRGKGNKERFNYWLHTFRFAEETAHLGCIMGEIDKLMQDINEINEEEKAELVRNKVLPLRIEATEIYEKMLEYLLSKVSTTDEIGTIVNLEQHNLKKLKILSKHDSTIATILNESLPLETQLKREYGSSLRIIVPAKRTLLESNEDLNLKAIILSKEPIKKANLYWRFLGYKRYQELPLQYIARGVYKVVILSEKIKQRDFEYYIKVESEKEKQFYPSTAPKINHAVVIM